MKAKIKTFIIDNFRYEISKDQVAKMLKSENIPLKTYNGFIFKILLKCEYLLKITGVPRALNINTFLDKEFLFDDLFLVNSRGQEEAFEEEKTLFEKKEIPIEYYSSTMHLSYRLLGRMIAEDEIQQRFRECSIGLGLSNGVGKKCAEHLRKGLQVYVQKIVNRCNSKITITSLKTGLEKHMRLFNGLDMF
ncbi:hypothetical protein EHEL_111940 [Encephalitozoon hellem ATCC 50504]|uniref:Kv channel-interacting protein 1 n=1 Tax=Encephalitozoon hellem TaxID=27973 RepID=A0A9Q9CEM4_ENCHE|nr:uncharacterized protein EHEL_111940 [Encephalitozoon hellem ATCC 50504]AFM99467.1 hypothetical protein EHEL_111940 [Encephalitozoon hellem ATCC 50504]UTX44478.1 Kv channel-interacting protein 1 [Encephalitozoon hellem]|eukprot:XP_003888448.1 hypothetical protein EHEL_111940 [Encephalitozoon hellem ATCC 50504]